MNTAKRLQHILADLENGFTSESAKKNTLSNLNVVYEDLCSSLRCEILSVSSRDEQNDMTDSWRNLYWSFPNHVMHWNENKYIPFLTAIPQCESTLNKINDLVALRNEIKEVVVNKPVKVESEIEIRIRKSMQEEMDKVKSDYAYGIKLHDIFGKLPVYVNAHWVVNQHGTEFVRCFYYLNGSIVKLNVIIALMQKIESRKEN